MVIKGGYLGGHQILGYEEPNLLVKQKQTQIN